MVSTDHPKTQGWEVCLRFHSQIPNPNLLAKPGISERQPIPASLSPKEHFVSGTPSRLSVIWKVPSHTLGSSSVGLGSWRCGCSPGSLGLPGTDPEEAILSAFRLFDPSGKGVVNKDE